MDLLFSPPPFHYLYFFFIGTPYITTTNRSHAVTNNSLPVGNHRPRLSMFTRPTVHDTS